MNVIWNDIYFVLLIIAFVFLLLGLIVFIIEKKLIHDREIEYSKSINLTEIRNQLMEEMDDNDYNEPIIVESHSLDENV
ncbi:MAG: hypothetical protein IKE70_01040 [Bacilli bacterium]|nr:hypothetical protein [Bacilli bacterium]